jgi:hypothetical protein
MRAATMQPAIGERKIQIENHRVLYRQDETRQRFYAKRIRDDYSDKFRVRRTVRAEIALREKGRAVRRAAGRPEGAETKVEGQESPSRPGNLVLSF